MFKGISVFFSLGLVTALGLAQTYAGVDPEKTLIFRDLEVVDGPRAQPGGPWSFDELARKATRSDPNWIQPFLAQWQSQSAINGQPLEPRRSFDLLGHWKPGRAPFRLLAIVFRLDLRSSSMPAGEGRFVFGLAADEIDPGADLTLILEYPLPVEEGRTLRSWAKDLALLEDLQGEARLAALERLTAIFSDSPVDLNLRTNDFFFTLEWELRNFRLRNRRFESELLPKTPADRYLGDSTELVDWIRTHPDAVASGEYELPWKMLAGASIVPDDQFLWLRGSGLPEPLRSAFALRTCNGCHSGETGTRFQHIFNRRPREVSKLSDFLLKDLQVRAADLDQIVRRAEAERRTLGRPAARSLRHHADPLRHPEWDPPPTDRAGRLH